MDTSYQTFDNPPDEEPDKDNKAGKQLQADTYTVGEAIEHIGFGRFQLKLSFICGFAWIADSMEIMILGMLGPVLVCQWNLDSTKEALTTTVVFCGFLIGSPVLGVMADQYGRKLTLIFCSAWGCYFGILSGLAPTYSWLLILRTLTGCGVAGTPQVITYFSEFLPVKSRGKSIICQQMFWAVGGMFEVLLAHGILETVGWRWWIMVSALPLALFVTFCFLIPKSPRYEMACGRPESADQILRSIAASNNTEMPKGKIVPEKEKPRGRFMDLWSADYRRTSILLTVIWFISAFSYYGIILLSTELIRLPNTCLMDGLDLSSMDTGTCSIDCVPFQHSDYMQLLWTSASELPGLVMTILLIDSIGRRWTLRLLFMLFSISCFFLFICMSHTILVITLFVARALISAGFQAVYVYTPEVFPTEVRALAIGLFSGCARVGAIITPFVAQVLLKHSAFLGVGTYAFGGIVAAIASLLLTIETKGRELPESH